MMFAWIFFFFFHYVARHKFMNNLCSNTASLVKVKVIYVGSVSTHLMSRVEYIFSLIPKT